MEQDSLYRIALWTKDFLELKVKDFLYWKWQSSSTNDWAKTQAFKEKACQGSYQKGVYQGPYFFLCAQQSQGRGYNNKKWEDSDLMLSLLWESDSLFLPLKACENFAQDLKKALKRIGPELPLRIKAPNDLYIENAKLAGLLLEVLKQGDRTACVLGLGLNVFRSPAHVPATGLTPRVKNINKEQWFSFLELLIALWSHRLESLMEFPS